MDESSYLLYQLLPPLFLFLKHTFSDALRGFVPFLCAYRLFALSEF